MANEAIILKYIHQCYKAYGKTGLPSLFGYILGKARLGYSVFFLLSVIACISAVYFHFENHFSIICFVFISFLMLRRDAFRQFRNDPAILMNNYLCHSQGYRYILFKEFIPQDLRADKEMLHRILRCLEQRKVVRQTNDLLKSPIVSFFSALTMMIVGALISQLIGLGIQLSVLAFLIVAIFFVYGLPFVQMHRSRAYKDAELSEFLLWLSIENEV